jgi:hypothetical protein
MITDEQLNKLVVIRHNPLGKLIQMSKIKELLKSESKWKDFTNRPKIVCLCGSTRFMEQFFNSGFDETMAGNIVLSVAYTTKITTPDGSHVGEAMGEEVKNMLDELHKRKIDLADEILVLNVDGYIGESTRSEIDYAIAHNKPVRYLRMYNSLLSPLTTNKE